MSVIARLGAFAVAVLLALGGGWAVGAAVGPVDDPEPAPRHAPAHSTPGASPTPIAHSVDGMSR